MKSYTFMILFRQRKRNGTTRHKECFPTHKLMWTDNWGIKQFFSLLLNDKLALKNIIWDSIIPCNCYLKKKKSTDYIIPLRNLVLPQNRQCDINLEPTWRLKKKGIKSFTNTALLLHHGNKDVQSSRCLKTRSHHRESTSVIQGLQESSIV